MRELIYYVAVTLDGFIAESDGAFDKFPWDATYGADLSARFPETVPAHMRSAEHRQLANQRFDAVLMGRNTYEVGAKEGITSPYPALRQYVFSRSMPASLDADVTLVSDDALGVVRELKREDGKAIWLCGGGALAATLFAAGLVDRLIAKVNPVVFGAGIPLLAGAIEPTQLELVDHKTYPSGHCVAEYRVKR
jgi:dihydrofolate reductase